MNIIGLDVAPPRANRSTTIMGLDLSVQRSGVAIFELGRHPSSIETRSIITKTIARQRSLSILDAFFDTLLGILLEIRPDFLAIEEPRKDIQLFKTAKGQWVPNPGSTLEINQIYGNARAVIRAYTLKTGDRLPFETVPMNTWRKAMYGFGNRKGVDMKEKAREECRDRLRITVRNDDEAEAALIALYAPNNMQTLKDMLNRMEMAA